MKTLSIIVPVFNEEQTVPIFFKAVEKINKAELGEYRFEYWFIDDGSRTSPP